MSLIGASSLKTKLNEYMSFKTQFIFLVFVEPTHKFSHCLNHTNEMDCEVLWVATLFITIE
jgi:hypothetical protein